MNETLSFFHIDTRNPLHAKAYLRAASFYLSSWPQEWDAETLALALLESDETEGKYREHQLKIRLWNPVYAIAAGESECPYLVTERFICDLAEEFVLFVQENKETN